MDFDHDEGFDPPEDELPPGEEFEIEKRVELPRSMKGEKASAFEMEAGPEVERPGPRGPSLPLGV